MESGVSIKFKSIGTNCQISPFARFYNPENIEIGNNVRIDDFCILSAGEFGIKIGSHIHIACHTTLIGKEQIILEDYSGVGGHCAIYSSSDDFSGNALVGPTIIKEFTNVKSAPVHFKKYAVIGSHTVVLPGVTLEEGCAVGCMSLVKSNLGSYQIHAGIPAKYIKDRETRMTKFTNPPKEHKEHYIESLDWTIKTDEPFYGSTGRT
jgi:galactoside O-acetyltransferase